jgi:hypothetical protein
VFELSKPKRLDLNNDNKLDTVLTYEKFFSERNIRIKIEEITKTEQGIDKKDLERQNELLVSTQPLYESILGITHYMQKFVIGENEDHYFRLEEVKEDHIKLVLDDKEYVVEKNKPLRLDLGGDSVLDIIIEYERFVAKDIAKINIKQITGFETNKLTALVVQEKIKTTLPKAILFLFVLLIVATVLGFLNYTK